MPTIPLPDILLILGILAAIVGACTLFTNAIEWVGHRCNLSAGVVGSVLAAVGTALPETIVPIVAIVSGAVNPNAMSVESAGEIGTGAILGAPFMLGTLAMFITGLAVLIFTWLKKRTLHMPLDHEQLYRDMTYFFVAYGIAACSALIPASASGFRYGIAVLLLGIYGLYLYKTLTDTTEENTVVDPAHPEENEDHHLDPLYFAPKTQEPATALMLLQTLIGVGLIVLLAHYFVGEINHLATSLKLDAMVLSLIIIPIATELPEKFNSVMWISQRKDTLAMGKQYIWDFNDGSAPVITNGPTISHTFTSAGMYRVKLIAVDSSSCNIADSAYINLRVRNDKADLSFVWVSMELRVTPLLASFPWAFDH